MKNRIPNYISNVSSMAEKWFFVWFEAFETEYAKTINVPNHGWFSYEGSERIISSKKK